MCKFVREISFNDAIFFFFKDKYKNETIHLKIKEKEKLIGLRSYYLHEAF